MKHNSFIRLTEMSLTNFFDSIAVLEDRMWEFQPDVGPKVEVVVPSGFYTNTELETLLTAFSFVTAAVVVDSKYW